MSGSLWLLAAGLSMDAFAASVCRGLAAGHAGAGEMLRCGVWFGGAQALMPVLGFFLGSLFAEAVGAVDHYVAFFLLALIGGNMIREAFSPPETCSGDFSPGAMAVLALATSVDAMAAGVTLAMLPGVRIVPAALEIGMTTGILSAAGCKAGSILGRRGERSAELAGGVILIAMGCRILAQHLGGIR